VLLNAKSDLMLSKRSKGDIGELFAIRLLSNLGYNLIERNFHSKFGEIDIIAQDGNTLSFLEVKTRWSKKYGKPEESITPNKIRKIKKTIDYYLLMHNLKNIKNYKIEIVALEADAGIITSSKIIRYD